LPCSSFQFAAGLLVSSMLFPFVRSLIPCGIR
jgi:hypothetical protein